MTYPDAHLLDKINEVKTLLAKKENLLALDDRTALFSRPGLGVYNG